MELYHASKEIVQYPEIRKAKYTKDFSWGFYCTNNMQQAIRWANRGIGEPIINYYDYNLNDNLKILKFPEISDEWLDFIAECRIGKLYSIMIEDCAESGDEVKELMKIFCSFISDAISNFNSDLYYQNPYYLEWSYREGKLLE